ncbi:YqaA family protein [Kingella negevensis]|uniref:YqaA family protein n=1 Tax=Kingella negevensis TaxID=1522312 RepID=UPI00050A03E9|nr:VTT domain-containing protein [Kingella negevensis]MDK4688107.1 VTT domain-containing protein [Kingella negevensis]WII90908.1 VTT domain-containing protein [Kingella negevensis]
MIEWSLWALAVSAFTSATIWVGTSEVAFVAFVMKFPDWAWAAFLVAGVCNTLGSLVSYAMGRCLPEKYTAKLSPDVLARLQKWGAWGLVLAWLPVLGDALPIAAGFLRLSVWRCVLALAAGKFFRYGVLWISIFQAA